MMDAALDYCTISNWLMVVCVPIPLERFCYSCGDGGQSVMLLTFNRFIILIIAVEDSFLVHNPSFQVPFLCLTVRMWVWSGPIQFSYSHVFKVGGLELGLGLVSAKIFG